MPLCKKCGNPDATFYLRKINGTMYKRYPCQDCTRAMCRRNGAKRYKRLRKDPEFRRQNVENVMKWAKKNPEKYRENIRKHNAIYYERHKVEICARRRKRIALKKKLALKNLGGGGGQSQPA